MTAATAEHRPGQLDLSENGAKTAWPYCWVTVRGLRKRSTQVAA